MLKPFSLLQPWKQNYILILVNLKVSVITKPIIAGNDGNLTCEFTEGNATSFMWKKNSIVISGQTTSTLMLKNVSQSDNGAVYTCIATTSKGNNAEINATLAVYCEYLTFGKLWKKYHSAKYGRIRTLHGPDMTVYRLYSPYTVISWLHKVFIINTRYISDLIGWEQRHKSHISYSKCEIWPCFIFRGLVSKGAKWIEKKRRL